MTKRSESLSTTYCVVERAPKATPVALLKPEPETMTSVPPLAGPEAGRMLVIWGGVAIIHLPQAKSSAAVAASPKSMFPPGVTLSMGLLLMGKSPGPRVPLPLSCVAPLLSVPPPLLAFVVCAGLLWPELCPEPPPEAPIDFPTRLPMVSMAFDVRSAEVFRASARAWFARDCPFCIRLASCCWPVKAGLKSCWLAAC